MDLPPVEEGDPELAAFWLRFWRWTVAGLQVIGGLFGLYAVMFGTLLSPSRVFFLLTFLLFAASVWGGVLLARDRPGGVVVSLVIQALQLVQIANENFVYSFLCGVQLVLGVRPAENGPEIGISMYFPDRFIISLNPSFAVQGIGMTGVNVVAALAIICLLFVRSARSQSVLITPEAKPPADNTWSPAPEQ